MSWSWPEDMWYRASKDVSDEVASATGGPLHIAQRLHETRPGGSSDPLDEVTESRMVSWLLWRTTDAWATNRSSANAENYDEAVWLVCASALIECGALATYEVGHVLRANAQAKRS